jgi:hypothetical protein
MSLYAPVLAIVVECDTTPVSNNGGKNKQWWHFWIQIVTKMMTGPSERQGGDGNTHMA